MAESAQGGKAPVRIVRKRPRSESPDAQCSTPVPGCGETVLDPGYHISRSKVLTSLWENRELSDVEVVVEGQSFPAHRVILAAGSPHFRAMFTCTFSESRQREVELHEMPANGFQGVLTFLYSGELALTDSNAEDVLLAADRCEVLGLVNLCCNYLLDRISWPNCLHYWVLADQVGCVSLRKKSRLVALKFFEELHNSQQLLALDNTRLSQMIKSKKLRSANEQVVLEALLAWLAHDTPARCLFAVDLLRLVRLPRIKPDILEKLKGHAALQGEVLAPALQSLLDQVDSYNLKRKAKDIVGIFDVCPEDVKLDELCNVAKSLGLVETEHKLEGETMKKALVDELRRVVAENLTAEEQRKHQPGGESVWTKKRWCECFWLYAVGGSDGQHHLDSVERYEAVQDVWHAVAPMRTARRNCGVGVLNGQLYAVGGRNENKQVMDNIERYDSKEDRWERVEHPMRTGTLSCTLLMRAHTHTLHTHTHTHY